MTSLEFVNPSGDLTLSESQIISLNPVLVHTGKGDLRATVEETRALDDYAQRQDRLNLISDGSTIWTGYLVGVSHNERQGTTTIRADGIAKRLEETRPDYESLGGPVQYSSTGVDDAIRDYWSRTEFANYTVTDQTPETVATNEELQSADTTTEWGNISTIPDTTPLKVQNGNIELLQVCFTEEGENQTNSQNAATFGNSNYSDGFAGGFNDTNSAGDYLEWEFALNYTIAESDVEVSVRDADGGNDVPGVTWYLNGNEIDSYPAGSGAILNWTEVGNGDVSGSGGYTGGDLSAGTHTLRVELDEVTASGQEYHVDVIAPYDNRYTYTFDNDNGGNDGYLDGPELYPATQGFALDDALTNFNIDNATATTTWNDTSNNQAIALSNDGGATYNSASNTSTHSVDFVDAGRTAKTKITFSRYGSRTTATPQTGFNGQLVQDYTLTADLNNLVVIDELDLTRNHFDNLQTLHDYGDFNWVIEHDSSDISNLLVASFQVGDETRTSPSEWDNPENINSEVAAEFYFNSIYLEGAKDANGDRPSATSDLQSAINNDGRRISPGVLRDLKITTETGAQFKANSLLTTASSNNDLEGTITGPPVDVHPGYSYLVDFGEGEKEKTLEETSIKLSQNELSADYQFTVKDSFGEDISKLQRNTRQLEDQV